MEGSIREARLRPQPPPRQAGPLARRTPQTRQVWTGLGDELGKQAGTWQPASAIGRQLLLWHLTASTPPQGERLMSEEHFEFRGGIRRNGAETEARTRHADRPTA